MAGEPLTTDLVGRIAAELRLRGRYRDRVLAEIEAHLDDAVDAAVASGHSLEEANELAVRALGDPRQLSARFVPQPTRWTRVSGALFFLGLAGAAVAGHAVDELHADGGRLGRSPAYTAAWLLGGVSLILLFAPVIGLIVRHRGRLGVAGGVGVVSLGIACLVGLGFHLSNDGSLDMGPDTSVWRLGLIAAIGLTTTSLGVLAHRARLVGRWPLTLAWSGAVLLMIHYVAVDEPGAPLAVLGLVTLAAAVAASALTLWRERPLA